MDANVEITRLIEIITDIRSQRVEFNVPPSAFMLTTIIQGDQTDFDILNQHIDALKRMAKIKPGQKEMKGSVLHTLGSHKFEQAAKTLVGSAGSDSLRIRSQGLELLCFLDTGNADPAAERARLTKSAEASEKEAASLAGRLNNPAFVEKAKPEAVEKARADYAEKSAEADRLRAALARLG